MAGLESLSLEAIKSSSLGILNSIRSAMLNVSSFLAKYIPFDADKISLMLFLILSLFIASKIINPKDKSIGWLILGIAIFYVLYMFK